MAFIYRAFATFVSQSSVRNFLIPVFTFATALGAFLKWPIPGSPVPVTLQTFFVLLAGMSLGSSRGAISQIIFVALSAAGLPWIAGPSILGPTAGYLVGFILAAAIMGLRHNHLDASGLQSTRHFLLRALVAEFCIFGCGVAWLHHFLHLSWNQSLAMGLTPFVMGEVLKLSALGLLNFSFFSRKGI